MIDLEKKLKKAQSELNSGSPENALEILIKLRDYYQHADNKKDMSDSDRNHALIKIFNNLGVVQKNFGALEDATDSLEEALKIAIQLGDDGIRFRTGTLSNLGLLYSRRKEFRKGLETFEQALDLATSYPDQVPTNLRVKLHNNRALFFVRFGEPDKAREELAHALETAHDEAVNGNMGEREAWLTANLAMIHAELGGEEIFNPARQDELYRQARAMFIHSADLYGHAGYTHHRLKQLLNAAEINFRLNAFEEASRLLAETEREAKRLSDPRLLCEVSQMNLELALLTRNKQAVDRALRETVKILCELNPPDLPARWTRMEGILRRHGRADAIKLLSELSSQKKAERPSNERTRT